METESVTAEKGPEDVEMKNAEPLDEEKEDLSVSPLAGTATTHPSRRLFNAAGCFGCWTDLCL
jgi:hypothetical protein